MEPRVHLLEPMVVSGATKVTLTPWPKYTDEKHILLHSDSLLTVMEANEAVELAYLKKIGKTVEDFIEPSPPVLLNEEEQVPTEQQPYFDHLNDDEYEPRYTEEV